MTKNKTFLLNKNLTCANYSLYVATCAICYQQYCGQTVNKFSTRWLSHRSNSNKLDDRMTATKRPYRGTIQCSMTS